MNCCHDRDILGKIFHTGCRHKPDEAAIFDGKKSYSFAELEGGATALARFFRASGVTSGDRIVVLTDKRATVALIIAAIWKVGACYVPVDAENPVRRTLGICERLTPKMIIGAPLDVEKGWPVVDYETIESRAAQGQIDEEADFEGEFDPESAAYVIHTSGSTGEPKGVVISRKSLNAYFESHNRILQFGAESRVLKFSPYHFDLSIEDTMLPLSRGAFVHIFGGALLGPIIRTILLREKFTHLVAVSTILALITEDGSAVSRTHFSSLGTIVTGAELCESRNVNCWLACNPQLRVLNGYGPTEVTINAVSHTITKDNLMETGVYPIGTPMDGINARIFDLDKTEVGEPGRVGELWLSGVQVMQGYYGSPSETEKVLEIVDGERFYKTGDLCRFEADGNLAYVGRIDNEVKLDGRRIHLGEIQSQLLQLPGVQHASLGVVSTGERQYIAAVIFGGELPSMPSLVIDSLTAVLPNWMMPKIWAWGRHRITSASGKTNDRLVMEAFAQTGNLLVNRVYRQKEDGKYQVIENE